MKEEGFKEEWEFPEGDGSETHKLKGMVNGHSKIFKSCFILQDFLISADASLRDFLNCECVRKN